MYRRAIITFIDILGFKQLIESQSFEQVHKKLSVVRRLSEVEEQADGEGFEPKVIQFRTRSFEYGRWIRTRTKRRRTEPCSMR